MTLTILLLVVFVIVGCGGRIVPVWKDAKFSPTVKFQKENIAKIQSDPFSTIGSLGIRVKVPFWTLPPGTKLPEELR